MSTAERPPLELVQGGGERAERNSAAVDLMQGNALRRNERRGVVACYANTVIIARRFLGTRLAYNEMSEMPELDGAIVGEAAVGAFRCSVDELFSYSPSDADAKRALVQVAYEHRYHPVRRYLEALPPWDGTRRWAELPATTFGVADASPIVAVQLERWSISAVARAFQPGCQVDQVLVLQGKMALRKSTFFRALGGEWFAEGNVDLGVEGVRALSRKWIWCWDELAGLSKRERAELDGFITRTNDQMRPLYRDFIDHPRTTVIVATANPEELFDNPEGLRRWWVAPVERRMGPDEIAEQRDQLWAEALHRYRNRERWYLDGEDEEAAHAAHVDRYRVAGGWDQRLGEWVRSADCRLLAAHGGRQGWITTGDALDALDIPPRDRRGAALVSEAGAALRRVGCQPVSPRPRLHATRVSAYRLPPPSGA